VQIAQKVGADVGILSDASESPLAVGDRIKAALGPRGPAVVFDCVGFEATMQVCSKKLKRLYACTVCTPSAASRYIAGRVYCLAHHQFWSCHASGSCTTWKWFARFTDCECASWMVAPQAGADALDVLTCMTYAFCTLSPRIRATECTQHIAEHSLQAFLHVAMRACRCGVDRVQTTSSTSDETAHAQLQAAMRARRAGGRAVLLQSN
jgi:threonine dehydrogenase-like Zn-dependent dehydrogenase